MKHFLSTSMRKMLACVACSMMVVGLYAVPAYRGWQTKIQPDGTTVRVRLMGDEFYHFWVTEEGTLAEERANGLMVKTGEPVPSREVVMARRMASRVRKAGMPQEIGDINLPPRGVVILVDFADSQMQDKHTRAQFDDLCNAIHCTTNTYNGKNYGSAAQYFADQSKGEYRPVFDVFGPIQLPNNMKYYGEQGVLNEKEENDLYVADFAVDAVLAADSAGCDFSQYDSDEDGYVDFVYIIYAGKGQASGGTSETIWPHNWNIASALYTGFTHGTNGYYCNEQDCNLPELDGVMINNYACSAELDYSGSFSGIGTLCHEFGHVLGLPDFYDVQYGDIYKAGVTPTDWDVMDYGSYNGNSHCPPNYSPWEKAFFGWVEPVNLGSESSTDSLYADCIDYNVYQINESGIQQSALDSGVVYYLENRQQSSWDEYVPAHGMVVWRLDYDAEAWKNNVVNASSTENAPRCKVVAAGETEWKEVKGKPVKDVVEKDGMVVFKYKNGGTGDYPALPEPVWTDWAYYDDGTLNNTYGYNGEPFYWGVMFPAYSMTNNTLTKLSMYETSYNTQPIAIAVYSGGYKPQAANLIYTDTVNPAGVYGWHEFALSDSVVFNRKKNLWVVLSEGTDKYPAAVSVNTGDINGRWQSADGNNWVDVKTYGWEFTFMLRAYTVAGPEPKEDPEPEEEGIDEVQRNNVQCTKVIRDGQLIIMRGDKVYTLTGSAVQ